MEARDRPDRSRLRPILLVVGLLAALTVLVRPIGAGAEPSEPATVGTDDGSGDPAEGEVDPAQAARDALLVEGAEVYSQICSSCHQPGGAGLPGQYPPLIDNPAVDDGDYVVDVIANGRQGELVVDGVTYDGVMPAFSTLSDDEVEAVVAYLQADFAAPVAATEAFESVGPTAGTELPGIANATTFLAFALTAVAVGLVLAPRLIATNDRLATPWLDVWLKTAAIVVIIVLATVVIPDWILQLQAVGDLDRTLQDLIAVASWGIGFLACLVALWYFHRESRI